MNADFFERQRQAEVKRKIEFAAGYGVRVKRDEVHNLWRVYAGRQAAGGETQIAMCTIEEDAADVAYALAMMNAGARLPDNGPDVLGEGLNSGDGTYRP